MALGTASCRLGYHHGFSSPLQGPQEGSGEERPQRVAREWLTYCAALYNAAVQCEHLRQAPIAIELFRRSAGSAQLLVDELRAGEEGQASSLDSTGFTSADADATLRLIAQVRPAGSLSPPSLLALDSLPIYAG